MFNEIECAFSENARSLGKGFQEELVLSNAAEKH